MNVSPQNLIATAGTAPAASASVQGTTQGPDDNGMFAALMAGQTGSNISAESNVKTAGDVLSAGANQTSQTISMVPVRHIDSPFHEPLQVSPVDGTTSQISASGLDSASLADSVQMASVNETSHEIGNIKVAGFDDQGNKTEKRSVSGVKEDSLDPSAKSGLLDPKNVSKQNVVKDVALRPLSVSSETVGTKDDGSTVIADADTYLTEVDLGKSKAVPVASDASLETKQSGKSPAVQTGTGEILDSSSKAEISAGHAMRERTGMAKKTDNDTAPSVAASDESDVSSTLVGESKEISNKKQSLKGSGIAIDQVNQSALSYQMISVIPVGTKTTSQNETTNNLVPATEQMKATAKSGVKGTVRSVGSLSMPQQGAEQIPQDLSFASDDAAKTVTTSPGSIGQSLKSSAAGNKKESPSTSDTTQVATNQPVASQQVPVETTFRADGNAKLRQARGYEKGTGTNSDVKDDTDSSKDDDSSSIAPVSATSSIAQPHVSVQHAASGVPQIKNAGATSEEGREQKISTIGTVSGATFTTAQAVKFEPAAGSRNQQVEVGFHDGTLGWLSVRATAATEGGLHLSMVGKSNEMAASVEHIMPSLQHYLQDHNVRAHSVTFASQADAAIPVAVGNMSTSSFSQNTGSTANGDGRNGSLGQQRSGSGNNQQELSQKERNTMGRTFQPHADSRYEGSLQEQGLLSVRI